MSGGHGCTAPRALDEEEKEDSNFQDEQGSDVSQSVQEIPRRERRGKASVIA